MEDQPAGRGRKKKKEKRNINLTFQILLPVVCYTILLQGNRSTVTLVSIFLITMKDLLHDF